MDMSLAEMEGHARTHKQARPIFDSGRDDENKQGQRGERVQREFGEGKKQHSFSFVLLSIYSFAIALDPGGVGFF